MATEPKVAVPVGIVVVLGEPALSANIYMVGVVGEPVFFRYSCIWLSGKLPSNWKLCAKSCEAVTFLKFIEPVGVVGVVLDWSTARAGLSAATAEPVTVALTALILLLE